MFTTRYFYSAKNYFAQIKATKKMIHLLLDIEFDVFYNLTEKPFLNAVKLFCLMSFNIG